MTADKQNKKPDKAKKEKTEEIVETVETIEVEDAGNELDTRITELEKEISALTDSYQRLAAEYDNFRKRTAREKDGIFINATSNLIEAFLPVIDSIEIANKNADSNADKGALKKGIEMMYRQFREILDKLDIEIIESIGEEFNPEYHHAVEHIDDEKYGENEVVAELVKGYLYKDKVIRHSLVKVAN
jgi:molecular chaperone GrpE